MGRVSGTPPGVLQTHEIDGVLRDEVANGTQWVQPSASLDQRIDTAPLAERYGTIFWRV